MDAEEQSSRREECRQLVRRHRKNKNEEKYYVKRKFLAEVANAGGNIEEAKVMDFSSIFGNKNGWSVSDSFYFVERGKNSESYKLSTVVANKY